MADTALPAIDRPGPRQVLRAGPWLKLWPVLLVLLALATVPVVATAAGEPFLIRVFTRIVIFALAAAGLNLVLGFGGLVSLAHASLFGIGGYVVAILAQHEAEAEPFGFAPLLLSGTSDLMISVPLAVLASGLVAAAMGIVAIRTGGAYFIMITLAFNQMLYYFFVALQRYGGEDGLQILGSLHLAGLDVANRVHFYYACLVLLGLVLVATQRLVDSRFGMVLRATAQNERRVVAVGLAPLSYKLVAFALSGAIAGLAGALMAVGQQFISPVDMAWIRSGDLVVICVMGGLTVVVGPVIGAAVFLMLELVLSSYTSHWHLPFGIIVIGLAVVLRGGLADLPRRIAGKFGRGERP
ncbi:branched-chain amino acid ABC transporter permease [Phreatobacter stygius]|uniref:Branched-chain amino acid ABC transporter permease n=1 Tax=Phreatobacter stygius TaxID=1940610 RepID=A0A4D7B1A3_9HYPH|nr:branched-chain amino acid ABC transporter permease [Phreatobacter stygius]QCI64743.1 branched-chain amino acid ABC transporter permease [Phreatobacter stygius]